MQLIREYQLKDVNWVLTPGILKTIDESIPPSEFKHDGWDLAPLNRFGINTFSQYIEVESLEDFLQFLEKTSEPPLQIEVEVCCAATYRGSGISTRTPSFFKLIWGKKDRIRIEIARTTAELGLSHLQKIEKILQLVAAAPAPSRVPSDEEKTSLKKQVFIAHSFDEKGRAYAYQLTKILNLLGFEVATGEGFSTEKVSTKIKRRLLAKELVIAIVSPKDDNTWLIQEMAGADFLGKPLIPLVEEGAQFKPGVLGDIEYIRFKEGEITQTFTPLIEGLRELGYSFAG